MQAAKSSESNKNPSVGDDISQVPEYSEDCCPFCMVSSAFVIFDLHGILASLFDNNCVDQMKTGRYDYDFRAHVT
jgi:hypothetical protein